MLPAPDLEMGWHAFEQHTSDVQVRVDAATLVDLFTEAGRALAEIIGTPAGVPSGAWRRVSVDARDRDALLVAWVNELIARTEIDDQLYTEIEVVDLTATRLDARIRGVPIAETRTPVKAATMHGLQIGAGAGGVSATLILDV